MPRRALVAAAIATGATALVLVVAFLVVPGLRSDAGVVELESGGTLRGSVSDGVRSWRGVPYAEPPVGERRWRPPAPVEPWSGERNATEYAAPCLQPAPYTFDQRAPLKPLEGSSEDCLYLNLSRPDDEATGLPVVVWLHGGGFFGGNGNSDVVNESGLVDRGALVVSVNYRLGRLGFFGHPAIRGDVGNFALLDQIAALRWVQDNIAAFGGDPDNVTLMGGSAGAMAVNALLATDRAAGLFDRAVALSAPSDVAARTLAEARRLGARDFPGLAADDLRALPAEDLLSSSFNVLTGDAPLLDAVLPTPSARVLATGGGAAVPYLVGTTSHEWDDAVWRSLDEDPVALRASLGGPLHARLERAYGRSFDPAVLSDLVFVRPAWRVALGHDRSAPTYRYLFDGLGADSTHGTDLPYLLDLADVEAPAVADRLCDLLFAFAQTGHPGSGREWPRVSTGRVLLVTDAQVEKRPDPTADRLRALDRFVG